VCIHSSNSCFFFVNSPEMKSFAADFAIGIFTGIIVKIIAVITNWVKNKWGNKDINDLA